MKIDVSFNHEMPSFIDRIRVRDINDAFKEVGNMVTMHLHPSNPLTKLAVLQNAVSLITTLEQQVRGKNSNEGN